jgi:hypothetical protein
MSTCKSLALRWAWNIQYHSPDVSDIIGFSKKKKKIVFLCFDILILKIIIFLKNIFLIYFQIKNTLKTNHTHA